MKEPVFSASYWRHAEGPMGEKVPGQSCVKYIRFGSVVSVTGFRLEVFKRYWSGAGKLKQYPKHLRLSMANENGRWLPIYEHRSLPLQDVMEIRLEQAVATAAIKAELFEVYPKGNNHTEISENPRVVLFQALDHLVCLDAKGEPLQPEARGEFQEGRKRNEEAVTLENSWMKAGFHATLPQQTAWSWDVCGTSPGTGPSKHSENLISDREAFVNGPWLRTALADRFPDEMSGSAQTGDNEILYRNVAPTEGLVWNYRFTMFEDHLELAIEQRAEREIRAIECEAWRWNWNLKSAIFSPLAMPEGRGKNGRCSFPMIGHAPNFGHIAIELLEGDLSTTFLKTDTWRDESIGRLGIEVGVRFDEDGELVIQPGATLVRIRISRASLQLASPGEPVLPEALRGAWGSAFGFRPEYFGMSNNAASLNCHFVQYMYMDMANVTETSVGLEPAELMGYTVELALAGGAGYGDNREYFIDSDASLLIAAGVYLYRSRDVAWARRNWQYLISAGERLLEKRNEDGLIVCKKLSGNSGVRDWSSNWWDVIAFGHLDAYSNALCYRAFRLLQSVAGWIGQSNVADVYRLAADEVSASYFPCFFNKDTGWLAGWRSRDGKLHDYAFLFINGLAIVYGLVPVSMQRDIMERLERKRTELGYDCFAFGIPGNLTPICREDYTPGVHGSPVEEDGSDTFGHYQNGGATMSQAYHYVRALGKTGMPVAEIVNQAILDAFAGRTVIGGLHEGGDWKDWSGEARGYEGLLCDQCYVLLAVAQNAGLADELIITWD